MRGKITFWSQIFAVQFTVTTNISTLNRSATGQYHIFNTHEKHHDNEKMRVVLVSGGVISGIGKGRSPYPCRIFSSRVTGEI
jgi:hypothetical protein